VIVQVDAPAELYRYPADGRIAAFVGDAVLMPGIVRDGVAECVLGDVPVPAGSRVGRCELLIRPEQIGIDGAGGGAPAHVLQTTFFGHDATVRLRLVGNGPTVTARAPGYAVPPVGATVNLTVHGEATVLPAS
jgi:iron(III) transport system ATP-binding protein